MPMPTNDPAAAYFRALFAVVRAAILLLVGIVLVFISLKGSASNGSLAQRFGPTSTMALGVLIGIGFAALGSFLVRRALAHFLSLRLTLQGTGKH